MKKNSIFIRYGLIGAGVSYYVSLRGYSLSEVFIYVLPAIFVISFCLAMARHYFFEKFKRKV